MSENTLTALARISRAKQALAEARDIEDIIEIRDMAVAANAWATARGADEAAQMAMEIKLRAERKAGQFLADMKERGQIKPGNPQFVQDAPIIKLANIGVKPDESKRWQRIASIPKERFEEYLVNAKKRTQAALLRAADDQLQNRTPIEPKKRLFDVWSIAAVDLEKPFGDPEYPGAIPGDIVANVLMWFLPEGGKVVDPMAGGGVTEDVCRFLGPKYKALLYDNFSLLDYDYRPSILFNDIETGKLPEEAQEADLVFADPPYGPLKSYGMDPERLFVLVRGLARASWAALRPGGLVAVLMQNYYRGDECLGEFVPLIRRTAEILEGAGLAQVFEVTVPLYGKVARSEEHMTHIDRRLMIFQKEGD
jgi:hypothetical protein